MIGCVRNIATTAHKGQVDKQGVPYISHCKRVALRVAEQHPGASRAEAVAWLHDVVEDTDWTVQQLRECGIHDEVVDAVDAISHRPGESRADYYARVNKNLIARLVKIADIADNMDPRRLAGLDDATIVRLVKKYAKALNALSA